MDASPLTKAAALVESDVGYCISGAFEVSGKLGAFRGNSAVVLYEKIYHNWDFRLLESESFDSDFRF